MAGNLLSEQNDLACAFLFDSSAEGAKRPGLAFFTEAVLAALSAADPNGVTNCQLRVGVPMLPDLARRTTAVELHGRGGGRTLSHDVDTYKFVIWDWLDSLSECWSTIDLDKGSEIFRLHTGECVTLTAVDRAIRSEVDRRLRATPGYVGAFALDPGNLNHRISFLDRLIYAAGIIAGAVFQELSVEGDPDFPVQGASSFMPGGLIWKPYCWLIENGPPSLAAAPPSARGAKSAVDLARKHSGRVEHRLIEAIQSSFRLGTAEGGRSYAFEVTGMASDVLQALMPESKFTKYLFNADHKTGGPKSKFFTETLGIEPDDWRFLAAQFYEGLLLAAPEDVELRDWGDGYGLRFNAYIRVQGRSGVTAVVKTGWMMRPGRIPSLSSAMPADPTRRVVQPSAPPILPPGPRNDADWADLWTLANNAGAEAMEKTVPTPMFVEGFAPIAEGERGLGFVRVPDAQRDFAHWLLAQGLAHQHPGGDAVVCSPSSTNSLERGASWAQAFARVLMLNGMDAKVEQRTTHQLPPHQIPSPEGPLQ